MPENTVYVLYPTRWLTLLSFAALSSLNASQWITFAPILYETMSFFGVSALEVNFLSIIYMLTYPIFLPCGLYTLRSGGLRRAILIASVLTFLGSLGRWIGSLYKWFYVLFLGQSLSGIAQVFFLAIPPRLASIWFGIHERNTASAIAIMSNNMGIAVGYLMSKLLISSENDLPLLLLIQFCISCFVLISTFFGFKETPPTPPSASADTDGDEAFLVPNNEQDSDTISAGWFQLEMLTTKQLFADSAFLNLFLSYGFALGGQYALSTLLAEILVPLYPDRADFVGIIGFIFTLCGVLGTFTAGWFLDKKHAYRKCLLSTVFSSFLLILTMNLFLEFSIQEDLYWLLFTTIILYGFTSTAIMPTSFQFASELFYPLSETIVTSLINVGAQIFGMALIVVMTLLDNHNTDTNYFSMRWSMWLLFATSLMSVVLACFVNGPLKRRAVDYQESDETEKLLSETETDPQE